MCVLTCCKNGWCYLFKMPIEKNKQRSFSLAEKIKILKCLNEPGMTRKAVREKFDLSESTLRGFIKNTDKLFETFNCSSFNSVKRTESKSCSILRLRKITWLEQIGGFSPKNEDLLNPMHDVQVPSNMTVQSFEEVVDQDADSPVGGNLQI